MVGAWVLKEINEQQAGMISSGSSGYFLLVQCSKEKNGGGFKKDSYVYYVAANNVMLQVLLYVLAELYSTVKPDVSVDAIREKLKEAVDVKLLGLASSNDEV